MGNYRKARERKGYTAQEAATRLGVSITTLGSWENGKTSPTAQRLIQLCKLYECTADELLGIVLNGHRSSALVLRKEKNQ